MISLDQKEDIFKEWNISVIIPYERSNSVIGEIYERQIEEKNFKIFLRRIVDNSYKTVGWLVESRFTRGSFTVKGNNCFIGEKNRYLKAYDNLIKRIEKINTEETK
ncbi:MAG: hypothetical protein ACOC1P_01790 [Minisyncoccales bacterium]